MSLCKKSKTPILQILGAILLFLIIGCSSDEQDDLNTHQELPEPAMDFEFITEGEIPAMVQFINNSKNASIYEWDFGDGLTDNAENPIHTYGIEGNYRVTLHAYNEAGDKKSIFNYIQVKEFKPGRNFKKGLGSIGENRNRNIDLVKAGWNYGWNPLQLNPPDSSEFVPMIFGAWGNLNNVRNGVENALRSDGKYLLGYNEPERGDQGNTPVAKALEAWPILEESGLPLVSPAVAYDNAGRQWMDEFMTEANRRGYKMDYIAIHWYGDTSPTAFMNYLKNMHEKYSTMFGKNLPVWVTEFALADWGNQNPANSKFSKEDTKAWMQEVLPLLDEADFVYRYCWFSANPNNGPLGNSSLFENGELTELGKVYADFR